ncbi:hypothetical protein [Mesorhizobium amorphae]|uniref:hypothetical protein n=1 Tax=Mesorhizobium amorphae TaxID=71433 RepID=UPI00177D04DB|nr:hypothetical protein [Mesorhizobium amorphae]
MGKHFLEQEIDSLLDIYLEKYQDALQRMRFVMKHPFGDNKELISGNLREIGEVSKLLEFFNNYAETEPNAFHHLARDVFRYVADGLGLIGSRRIDG